MKPILLKKVTENKKMQLKDCQLRYSGNETFTFKKSVTKRIELHGISIYRTHSYIFKYE